MLLLTMVVELLNHYHITNILSNLVRFNRVIKFYVSLCCPTTCDFSKKGLRYRGILRIELGTSRTLSKNHTISPNALSKKPNIFSSYSIGFFSLTFEIYFPKGLLDYKTKSSWSSILLVSKAGNIELF